jgi:nucleoside-diphosphate-sugar epimerase
MSLAVAVTGPTGEIGLPLLAALEREEGVGEVRGMARRPFDPGREGWRKVSYRCGDVLDRGALAALFDGAEVAVHLAFAIFGSRERTRQVNLEGSRNVFEAAVAAGVRRLVYASSVAAYGFHPENPQPLDEEVPARGSEGFYYSAQKAELEAALAEVVAGTEVEAYVFRPCVVAGPRAQMLLDEIPYVRLSEAMPDAVRRLLAAMPMLKPVIPDPGTRFQLVHEDDVASAFVAGVLGRGAPGAYNLAGGGTLRVSDLARALGWYSIQIPELAVDVTAEVIARLPGSPPQLNWIHSVRKEVLMKTDRAKRELRWKPKYTGKATLKALVEARRD